MAPNKSANKNGTANNHSSNNNNNNNNNNHHNSINNNNSASSASSSGTANASSTQKKKKKTEPQKQIKVKKPIKTRDSDCCSINFIKYVLIIIDIIFFVSIACLRDQMTQSI